MSRVKALLAFTGATLLALSLSAQSTAPATPPPAAAPAPQASAQPTPQEQAHEAIEKVSADLNLTADQKSKLEPILVNEIQQVRDLKADTSMTPQQKQEKFQATLTSDHAKIDSILTQEQKDKLAQLRQKQQPGQAPPQQGQAPPAQQPAPPKQ